MKTSYPPEYPLNRDTLPKPSPIRVRFTTSKSLWFDMIFVAGNKACVTETAPVTWSEDDLMKWLRDLANGAERCQMEPDNEGLVHTVETIRLDEKRVSLRIYDPYEFEDGDPSNEPTFFLEAVVSRRKLVWETYSELKKVASYFRLAHPELGHRPDWEHIPEVEDWLDWPRYKHWHPDDVCPDTN